MKPLAIHVPYVIESTESLAEGSHITAGWGRTRVAMAGGVAALAVALAAPHEGETELHTLEEQLVPVITRGKVSWFELLFDLHVAKLITSVSVV